MKLTQTLYQVEFWEGAYLNFYRTTDKAESIRVRNVHVDSEGAVWKRLHWPKDELQGIIGWRHLDMSVGQKGVW